MKQSTNNVKWVLDASHSELNFKVKHLMISNVKGSFNKFTADIAGEDFFTSPVRVVVDATSIFTNDDGRDTHLKSADFFDVEQHKELIFESESFKKTDDDEYALTGRLTMKGVTHPVTLE
ncbi:MAG: YceI family protein [Ferruginibacter sp.]|nr:YceI family protein [Ferruginibacter sp.]